MRNTVGCMFFLLLFITVSSSSDLSDSDSPRVCEGESKLTVFAEVGDNITFNICIQFDAYLTLVEEEVRLGFWRDKILPSERLKVRTSQSSQRSHYTYFNITMYNVQDSEFGPMIFEFFDIKRSSLTSRFIYTILLSKKGIAFNIYQSLHQITTSTSIIYSGNSLYLMCESSEHPPSSLSIVKKYSKEIIPTTVIDGALVYHLNSVQCSDVGTYVCLYDSDSSQLSTLDVKLFSCPPQLCHKENETRTIFAAVNDNINVDICVVSWETVRLDSVFRNGNMNWVETRYENSSISKMAPQTMYWKVNLVLQHIQKTDFGNLSIKLTNSDSRSLIYEMVLAEQGIAFNIYKSLHQVTTSNAFTPGESLYLMCESSNYSASSLSIVKKYSNEILPTTVRDGALIYQIESVQCSHMGTYECLYANDTSQFSTLDVKLSSCPPQLCHKENETRTVFAAVNDNVSVDICVISWASVRLDSVFQKGNMNLVETRYGNSSISKMAPQTLYWKVNLVLQDIQETDFRKLLIKLTNIQSKPLIYEMVLAEQDFDFRAEGSSPSPFNISESLTLKCKTEGLQPSSLRIEKKDSNQPLRTRVVDGSLVYTTESLQCQDMGTYLCLFYKDTSQNVTLDVKSATCMNFTANSLGGLNYSVSDNISLVCDSSNFAPSDLSISVKGGSQRLKAESVNNTLVYSLHDVQCTDMATYICQHDDDTSYNATLDLPIMNCAPQLCPEENHTRTVTVELSSGLNISVCVISHDDFFLEKVFLGCREDKTLEKNRYKPYNSSEVTGEDLYHFVDIEMYNITEDDFGRVTFRLRHVSVVGLRLDVEITLQQNSHAGEGLHGTDQNTTNELTGNNSWPIPLGNSSMHNEPTAARSTSTSDSFMIYVISGVCSVVALVLLGIFIYCQIRVKNYRNNGNHTARTNPDAHCVLLNYLPKHVADDSTGGLKQSHDDIICTTSFYKASANDDASDEDDNDDREPGDGLDDELQRPGYHIYEAID